ncbi:MAG: hypothetical protein DRN20_02290 [Thermoplasmata archaeon]|nr:MAG: hypothetical protein DRN20_02290 [Thermoplasmata archaeon]
MTGIRRLILDVLKPREPSIIEIATKLSTLPGVAGVNCMLDEVDRETESIKITIEGADINYEDVKKVLEACGAAIHSIDGVSAGKRLVEDVETLQDR